MKSRKFLACVAIALLALISCSAGLPQAAAGWVCGSGGCTYVPDQPSYAYGYAAPSYYAVAPAYSYAAPAYYGHGGGYAASSCSGGYSAGYGSCSGGGGYGVVYSAVPVYSSCSGGGGYSYAAPVYQPRGFGFGLGFGW